MLLVRQLLPHRLYYTATLNSLSANHACLSENALLALTIMLGNSPNTHRLADPVPDPSPFEPKVNELRQSVEVYYCAKFQVIAIRGFVLSGNTHPHTHTHVVTK